MGQQPFEAVVATYGPMVLRVCRAVLGPTEAGGVNDAEWRQRCAAAGIADLPLAGAAARPPSRTI